MSLKYKDFSNTKVLIVGDIMLDRYSIGKTSRVSPEAPVPVVKIYETMERPGGAGNVALNVAALGAHAKIISIVGDDPSAATLAKELEAVGVTTQFVQCKSSPTIVKERVLSQNQQLLRLDYEESFEVDEAAIVAKTKKALEEHVDVMILSDYAKGVLNHCSKQLIELARKKNVPVLVDPKQFEFSHYQGATLITPNFKEFEYVVGPSSQESEVLSKANHLIEQFDFHALLITRGAEGMTLLEKSQDELYLAARGREVYDVTGAGDTVISAIAVALAAKHTLAEAVEIGNVAAGIVIGKLGAATVSVHELQEVMSGKHSIASGCVSEEELVMRVKEAKALGQKIIFTNGCFDVLHAMHVEYLQLAKQHGDKLIVAVNDDASITRLKGPGRPVNALEQRMQVLAGLESVDWVVAFNDDTPERLLELIQPEVLAKGGDYTKEEVVGWQIVEGYGGEVLVLGETKEGVKSTAIIERMKKSNND